MHGRIHGTADARESAIGHIPTPDALDLDGLDLAPETVEQLFATRQAGLGKQWASQGEFFQQFGDHLPAGMTAEHNALKTRIDAMQ